jgi:hypothetical protein
MTSIDLPATRSHRGDQPTIKRQTNRARMPEQSENGRYPEVEHQMTASMSRSLAAPNWHSQRTPPAKTSLRRDDGGLVVDVPDVPAYNGGEHERVPAHGRVSG